MVRPASCECAALFVVCFLFSFLKKLELLPKDYKEEITVICRMHFQFSYASLVFTRCLTHAGLELLSLLLPSGCRLGRHREELFYSGGGCRINVAQTCAWM